MEKETVKLLKSVRTIALVGASNKPNRASFGVMAFLLERGYVVTPVNPQLAGQEILGQRVYASLNDIPHTIDMVDVFRNSYDALNVTREAILINPKLIWLQLGVVNEEAKALALKASIAFVQDKCPKIELA